MLVLTVTLCACGVSATDSNGNGGVGTENNGGTENGNKQGAGDKKNNNKGEIVIDWTVNTYSVGSEDTLIIQDSFVDFEKVINEKYEHWCSVAATKNGVITFDTNDGKHIETELKAEGSFELPETFEADGISYTVAMIAEYGFSGQKFEKIVLPKTVIKLGVAAFNRVKNNDGTISVVLNEGLMEIGAEAFRSSEITEIHVPDSVLFLGHNVFTSCEKLTEVTGFKNVVWVGSFLFNNSAYEKALVEKGEVVTAGSVLVTFKGYRGKSYKVSDDIKCIAKSAGEFSNGIESIELGKNVISIGTYAFYQMTSLKEVKLNDGIKIIGAQAFAQTSINNINLPAGFTNIGGAAFDRAPVEKQFEVALGDAKMIVVNGVLIGLQGSSNDSSLEVTLPNDGSIKSIAYSGLGTSDGVKSVYIPKNIEIKYALFDKGYSNIEKVEFESGRDTLPAGVLMTASKLKEVVLPADLKEIPDFAFKDSKKLTILELPKTVTVVGKDAFEHAGDEIVYADRANMVPLDLKSVKVFKDKAMYDIGIGLLDSVVYLDSAEEIGADAFKLCGGVDYFVLNSNAKKVGKGAFGAKIGYTGTLDTSDWGKEIDNNYLNK